MAELVLLSAVFLTGGSFGMIIGGIVVWRMARDR